ncbi:MAG TPA: SDR family NAD(P)-dependent oxidoreductase [Polyangiaceae bacterium]|nr:SDR family NAD(P)-dependent oxidoreductase [Polyangiaceae bacterium]
MRSSDERIVALLQEARRQLEQERGRRTEPIAIVGIGCRLPGGADDPEGFWRLLRDGIDATSDVPADRWHADDYYDSDPEAPGKAYTRRGAFLKRVDGFDADFFGISPREALGMDPQQRMLLEVTWEALEDAGIAPDQLRGSATGVWVGLCVDDYARRSILSGDAAAIDAYSALGNTRSVAAGRISYVLDLHGPTVQIDTACSSSLVAVHQACQSLRSRECDLALVGGVNLMLAPDSTVALCKLRALAPDGRCKTFDAAADGYGRGEGCGIVVLQRLSDARTAGHRIRALIRGSASNHDGHSNGLTAPSGIAQEAVIRSALANAGLDPADVGYVEAHGTGTLLGDPIEVLALHRVYGQGRDPNSPLVVGSVKTNFGHLEGAAGVVGLIKAAVCLEREGIPASLNFHRPNPKIPWANVCVRVASEPVRWARNAVPRRAGISSFGISGTNAHVLLQEAPDAGMSANGVARSAELIVLSARNGDALVGVAERLREHIEAHPSHALRDLAHNLVTTRALLDHRLAFAVPDRAGLLQALADVAQRSTPAGAQQGSLSSQSRKCAWLFTGQGAQRLGMGRQLAAEWPVFSAAMDRVCALLDPLLDHPLRDVMWAEPGSAPAALLDQTGFTQPALFALEWALAELWRSWGIEPDLVLGHSIGELAAACVAGIFTIEEGARLVAARARLMQQLPVGGAMLAVADSEMHVLEAIEPYARTVSMAVVNAPNSVVIAGVEADVSALSEQFRRRGIQTRSLTVSHAFHSPLMEPILAEFRRVAESISYQPARVPIVADSSGALLHDELCSAEYWVRHVRETVRFAAGVQTLLAAGVDTFLELGPRPTLLGLVSEAHSASGAVLLASLRPPRSEPESVLEALGGWTVRGGRVDWCGVFPGGSARLTLPRYPWQQTSYWLDLPQARASGEKTRHPLLGVRVASASADAIYESWPSAKQPVWLGEHRVAGRIIFPAAATAELLRAAAEEYASGVPRLLTRLELRSPLEIHPPEGSRVQVVLSEEGMTASLFSQAGRSTADAEWTLHAVAELAAAGTNSPAGIQLEAIRVRCADPVDVSECYARFEAMGLSYGPSFRGLKRLWRGSGEALAEISVEDPSCNEFVLHPALLDAALQSLSALVTELPSRPLLPFELEQLSVQRPGASSAFVYARRSGASNSDTLSAQLTLVDPSGMQIAEIGRVSLRQVDLGMLAQVRTANSPAAFYRVQWPLVATPAAQKLALGSWSLLPVGTCASVESLALELRSRGALVEVAASTAAIADAGPEHVLCVFARAAGPAALDHAAAGLEVARQLSQREKPPRLWWVTTSGVAVQAEAVNPELAAIWGLGRSIQRELPALRLTLLDVESEAVLPETLALELGSTDDEDQVAWRAGQRHVARLMRAESPAPLPRASNHQLEVRRRGTFDGLSWEPAERVTPGDDEIEICVAASGLNFRDVLNVLGMYPGEAGPLGGECSGIVSAIGAGVAGYTLGDRVMAFAPAAFRRFVAVEARRVVRLPRGLSLNQAGTVPVAFLTAWYALHDLAQLRAGERVLIHAAAGGVGMAAVQIARWLGAEVLATASPSKWDALRALGVRRVASSRNLEFADEFRDDGRGVDVVLNSLASEYIDASLNLLSTGGRFIEMGKVDVRDPVQVAGDHPGVRYQAFDLTTVEPDHIATMLSAICRGFEDGKLTALPVRQFALGEAEAAFRYMAQARHVGKIALVAPRPLTSPKSTALITGGLGALGLVLAKLLAERGVEHLVLTSRRGASSPDAEQAVRELQRLGARVTVAAVDVTDRGALASLLAAIPAEYPLRIVVHAAGVLDDGLLAEQSAERLFRVMSPKVLGAWHLHELTADADLDRFIFFSSLAGTIGSAGQTGYAAANSFLDGLAAARRASGRPGLSLAWGPWAESGFAARLDSALQARLAARGMQMIAPEQGRVLFEQALQYAGAELVVAPLDLRRLAAVLGDDIPSIWRSMLRAPAVSASSAQNDWARDLEALAPEQRLDALRSVVQAEIARVLSAGSPGAVPLDRPLQELGLDSLMAVELRNALQRRTGVSLPATIAFDYPTPQAIAGYLAKSLQRGQEPSAQARPTAAPQTSTEEPIAIIGIGCRFPGGVTDPESFWSLLERGVDAITEVPRERWDIEQWYDADPDAVGKMTTRWGGFLSDLESFEPGFFGISPREAPSIDPQERLLLETSWEALEDAGIRPATLMGSDTGVYVGLCGTEYQQRLMADAEAIDAYSVLGTAHSTIAGRLSYWLGLKGPNLPVDTACSSSLVAVHLACQALRNAECRLALAGGANVLLSPEGTVYFSRLRAMSPTGRCHTFSADADGYVRSEGAGIVVLERLSDAVRNGHRIFATIRGSAVNQDGRSNGLTAPNGPAQQEVIQQALRRGGVAPSQIGYVECHGTGTPLGDPIEVQALAAVLSEGRSAEQPVVIGALKSNLGHMEGAAGVAGLIKAALTLQRERIPKSLHFARPNPHIAWADLPVRVAEQELEWARNGAPRFAGVSSFGISGTNAHVVLEEAPQREAPPAPRQRAAELVLLSAKTARSLDLAAGRWKEYLELHPELSLSEIAFSSVTTRSLLEHRLAISASSRSALLEALHATSQGKMAPVRRDEAASPRGKLAWLFTGQGAQQLGMGQALYAEWPAFRQAFDAVCEQFDAELQIPLRDVMWTAPGSAMAALLDETAYTQPALFVLEWALACLWRSWGVEPELLLGHSIGGITAAAVAGVFSVEDAVRLVAARARLMQGLPKGGAMLAVLASESEIRSMLDPHTEAISVAAVNGPLSVVLAGREPELFDLGARLESQGKQVRRLAVSHAFHSALMDPMLEPFRKLAGAIQYQPPRIPLVSDSLGALASSEVATPEYWVRHVRDTVRFSDGLNALARAGARTFLELGPRPTLTALVSACVREPEPLLLASLRPPRPEPQALLDALGGWVARGGHVDWNGVFPSGGRAVSLPTYAWQRERYWIERRATGPGRSTDFHASVEMESWFHGLLWREISAPTSAARAGGRWLVLGDSPEAARVRDALVALEKDASLHAIESVSAILARGEAIEGLIHVLGDEPAPELAMLAVQGILASSLSSLRAWWVTRGAVGTSPEDPPTRISQSAAWGVGRTIALEQPKNWGGLVDLADGTLSDTEAQRLASVVLGGTREDQLAVRGDRLLAPRVVRQSLSTAGRLRVSGSGTVLITGGFGALGLQIARWLIRRGAKHLVLVSRQGPVTADAEQAIAEFRASGAEITIAAAAVEDRGAMMRVLDAIPAERPLSSIFHVAGMNDQTRLDKLRSDRLAWVLAPKREGTLVLDELTRGLQLEAFVCFSSIAGVWGAGGQAAYAAANAFLDAWAHQARAAGRPAFSIAWGPWAGGGMADATARAQLERRGLFAMDSGGAIQALERVLSDVPTHKVIVRVDWQLFRRGFEAWGPRPLLQELPGGSAAVDNMSDAGPWTNELSALDIGERRAFVLGVVRNQVARVLGLPDASQVSPDQPLQDLGFDSLLFVELRSSLSRRTGMLLPANVAADGPTCESITRHLLEPVSQPAEHLSLAGATASPERRWSRGDVAYCEPLSRLESGLRLICFHDAGGSASMFLPLLPMSAVGIEIHAISHNRQAPHSQESGRNYVDLAAAYVQSLSDRPYAFFGHSVGALLAWRVAQELAQRDGRQPLFFAPSGVAPLVQGDVGPLDVTSLLRAVLSGHNEAKQRPIESFREDVAADLSLWQSLPRAPSQQLPIAISAFIGAQDILVTQDTMRRWQNHTTRDFSLTVLAGDHFYPYRSEFQEVLIKELTLSFIKHGFENARQHNLVGVASNDRGPSSARAP